MIKDHLRYPKQVATFAKKIEDYATLLNVYCHIGEYAKAEEYLETAIEASAKNGFREAERAACGILARWCFGFAGITSRLKNIMKTLLKSAKNLALDEN